MVKPLEQNLFCILESFCGIKKWGKDSLNFWKKKQHWCVRIMYAILFLPPGPGV